jgi:uncharacterized SAM-binding protein YcdF (DUF218 family)
LEIIAGYFIKALILPPGSNLFALLFAWLVLRRWRRMQRAIYFLSVVTLWMWCTPFVASWHARSLEFYPPVDRTLAPDADLVVILGGGRISKAPEFAYHDAIRADTLERVRYGAVMARTYGLPLAVAGGSVFGDRSESLAVLMASSLREDFGLEATWVEDKSRNTAQNARYLRELVPAMKIVFSDPRTTHAALGSSI